MLLTYIETADSDCADAWLERDGRRLPLRRVGEERAAAAGASPVHLTVAAVQAAQAALPDKRTRETIAAVAKASAALASVAPALETMTAVSRVVAAVERHGMPVLISSIPLSSDEAAQLLRDLPRLSLADEAAFAAAARDLPPLPDFPALRSGAIGPRPLSLDELRELERVGLGLPTFSAIA